MSMFAGELPRYGIDSLLGLGQTLEAATHLRFLLKQVLDRYSDLTESEELNQLTPESASVIQSCGSRIKGCLTNLDGFLDEIGERIDWLGSETIPPAPRVFFRDGRMSRELLGGYFVHDLVRDGRSLVAILATVDELACELVNHLRRSSADAESRDVMIDGLSCLQEMTASTRHLQMRNEALSEKYSRLHGYLQTIANLSPSSNSFK